MKLPIGRLFERILLQMSLQIPKEFWANKEILWYAKPMYVYVCDANAKETCVTAD